jgi:hypothetical protein
MTFDATGGSEEVIVGMEVDDNVEDDVQVEMIEDVDDWGEDIRNEASEWYASGNTAGVSVLVTPPSPEGEGNQDSEERGAPDAAMLH